MFRKMVIMAYKARLRLFELNLIYDKVKEPWRLLIALVLIAPWCFGFSAGNCSVKCISAIYLIALLAIRMYWHSWSQKHFGDGKS